MKVCDVYIMEEAENDLNEGRSFYDFQQAGIGDYFWDSLITDIESLILHAGIHPKKYGFYQILSKHFPYAVYYEIVNDIAYVAAVLPMRRNPGWIVEQLKKRS